MSSRSIRVALLGLLAGPSLLTAQAIPAQGQTLVGRIHDEAWRPVVGAEVILNRTELRAHSDRNGVFSIRITSTDSTIAFRRIGYRPLLVWLRPLPLRDTILVELRTSPVELPDLIVSAAPSKPLRYAGTTKYDEVFRRRKLGFGTLIPRETIEQHFGSSTAELLQAIPGVQVFNGPPKRLWFARCQDPGGIGVYIDGVRQSSLDNHRPDGAQVFHPSISRPGLNESPEIQMLSQIHPSDIEMIEVFRGVAQIPGVYHWNGCAVVAVWTRWR